ncbi:hypothetical protein BSPWISOX_2418 [uncultured Gammaproteobacteria bacterium]|nr:hypothetical protein BSPWISOX_2418 [uncultured Gammaproteobacteria bacterium]
MDFSNHPYLCKGLIKTISIFQLPMNLGLLRANSSDNALVAVLLCAITLTINNNFLFNNFLHKHKSYL